MNYFLHNLTINKFFRHFKTHPKTQDLFPKFAGVPLDQLPTNAAFLKQARSCVSFGLNFIVANLDNPVLLKDMLGRVDSFGKWYVDYMTRERQMKVFPLLTH